MLLEPQEKPGGCLIIEDSLGVLGQCPTLFFNNSSADQQGWSLWQSINNSISFAPELRGRIPWPPLHVDGSSDWALLWKMGGSEECLFQDWPETPSTSSSYCSLSSLFSFPLQKIQRRTLTRWENQSLEIHWFFFFLIAAASHNDQYSPYEPSLVASEPELIGPRLSSSLLLGQVLVLCTDLWNWGHINLGAGSSLLRSFGGKSK